MTAVWILLVIFSFLIICSFIEERGRTRRMKLKLEAMLREEEIRRGYKPGTYSSLGGGNGRDVKDGGKEMSREELQRGIKDLEERLGNLDTIIKNRKRKEE